MSSYIRIQIEIKIRKNVNHIENLKSRLMSYM